MKPMLIISLVVFSVLGIGLFVVHWIFQTAWGEEYERFHAVRVGMSEQEVIDMLGQPYKVFWAKSAPAEYYVTGWTFKRRSITNKVAIYIGTEPIAYIWYDERDLVEDVFVGGS